MGAGGTVDEANSEQVSVGSGTIVLRTGSENSLHEPNFNLEVVYVVFYQQVC